ncbi:cytochrome P450 [Gymnopilus junonius]|uniref:Cytochrome P450 n=1 Tax=Gymnopilus junonius TaxID=109634 RepID=A0A9P5NUG7_GYMJU|nr:cytochrome P450 [Gymnopilus junonius]
MSISSIARYAGFLTLMLLRRFTFLNSLPIGVIQGQALAKETIQSGVARQLVSRSADSLNESQTNGAKDLLTLLLNAAAEERISIEEVYEQISTFMIAGFETTTTTAAFAVWELARHPDKQDRLREELATISGEPTAKDMQDRLPYLNAIMKETLRLYPALPYMERTATKFDIIPLRDPVRMSNGTIVSEISVQPGQTVVIPIIAIQCQDDVWKDADEFRPERWLEELPPADRLPSGWGNMLAFSDGPRNCIGTRLAIFNFKIILAAMTTRFHFESGNGDMSLKISSSLQPWIYHGKDDPGSNELPVFLHVVS